MAAQIGYQCTLKLGMPQEVLKWNRTFITYLGTEGWSQRFNFDSTWSIIQQCISYTGGTKRCHLPLEEKLCILKDKNKQHLLKKSEIAT